MDAIEKKSREFLSAIRLAGAAGLYLAVKAASAHVTAGTVLQNPTLKNDKGDLATKLTNFGLAYLNSPEGTDIATVVGDKTTLAPDSALGTTTVATLAGATGVAFPRIKIALPATSNSRQSSYPTDALVAPEKQPDGSFIYDGIFLTATDKVTDPAKAYPAVASAANTRHKTSTPPRKFTSRVMDGAPFGQPVVNGVGIFRIE
jgi:hypothetical protein